MPTTTGATINWATDVAASSQVEYGLTTGYGTITPYNPLRVTTHSVAITGLTPGTAYFFRVRSRNAAGIETTGTGTFSTLAGSGSGSFTVTWTTSVVASSQVEYGLTTGYGTITPYNPLRVTSHSVGVSGVAAGTYHYRVRSRNAAGIEVISGDNTIVISGAVSSAMMVMVIS